MKTKAQEYNAIQIYYKTRDNSFRQALMRLIIRFIEML